MGGRSLLAALAVALPVPAVAQSARIALSAARLLDPASGTDRPGVTVIVVAGRIADIVETRAFRPRAGDRVVNLGASTLLPGLIDAHVHLSIGGPPRAAAAAIVKAGFTTVADLGAVNHRIQMVRDSVAQGAWDGPRILAAGLWIGVKNGVCEFGGIGLGGGADAFRARVRENVAAGADLIKACVTGWPADAWAYPDSAEMPLETLTALVQEAHAAGRTVVAHALSREGLRRALEAKVDGLAHAAYADEAQAQLMKSTGMWLIPTLASLAGSDTSAASRALVASIGRLFRNGVTLVYGTDGGVLPHGRNAEEAVAMAEAGIPPGEILKAATINAARALGLADSVGAIRAGMVADLVAVSGDPRLDLTLLSRPVFVMARGRVVMAPPGQ